MESHPGDTSELCILFGTVSYRFHSNTTRRLETCTVYEERETLYSRSRSEDSDEDLSKGASSLAESAFGRACAKRCEDRAQRFAQLSKPALFLIEQLRVATVLSPPRRGVPF